MAWTTPLTAVANAALTAAQWNASVRDDLLETAVAKATAAGRYYVSTAANALAERIPSIARVATSQTTTSTSFGDLATVGPAISTLATGISAIFIVGAFIASNTAQTGGYMGVTVSGASSVTVDPLRSLRTMSGAANESAKCSYVGIFDATLTAGNNTFTAKYAATTGATTVTYVERELLVLPL